MVVRDYFFSGQIFLGQNNLFFVLFGGHVFNQWLGLSEKEHDLDVRSLKDGAIDRGKD